MKTKLYMIPGLMCDERLWSSLQPLLEESYELIHLEIPYKQSLDEMVETLITYFPKEPINLLGFSLGGYIASYIACNYPSKIKRLMVMSATGCDLPTEEIEKRFNLINLSHGFSLKALSRQKVLTLLDKKHHDNESVIGLIGQMYKELGESVFKQQIGATLHRKDLLNDLQKITLPLLFLYGKGDRLVSKSWLKKLQDCSAHEQIALENDSHMLPLEEPMIVAKHIKTFFM